jgi:hypothetical protein
LAQIVFLQIGADGFVFSQIGADFFCEDQRELFLTPDGSFDVFGLFINYLPMSAFCGADAFEEAFFFKSFNVT